MKTTYYILQLGQESTSPRSPPVDPLTDRRTKAEAPQRRQLEKPKTSPPYVHCSSSIHCAIYSLPLLVDCSALWMPCLFWPCSALPSRSRSWPETLTIPVQFATGKSGSPRLGGRPNSGPEKYSSLTRCPALTSAHPPCSRMKGRGAPASQVHTKGRLARGSRGSSMICKRWWSIGAPHVRGTTTPPSGTASRR